MSPLFVHIVDMPALGKWLLWQRTIMPVSGPSLPAFPPLSLRKYVGSLLWPSYAKRCFSQGDIDLFGISAPPELRSKRMFHFCKPCQLTRFLVRCAN
ncbi:hypothetical protein AGR4A_pAt10505 [Agrobacterium tumefaciens str. B6]|uniref:Uncharacterized protein n=1 Tax=Agrobacterium tumefaciens str. B6 TaxID=1183423 RepID=A0A822VBA6_AGRTU|nr:hypothetical protein AGR4A_pAt10505 [Agrobacterium tumefaciens str. B6]